MKRLLAALVAALTLVMAGCGVTSGTVTDKKQWGEYWTLMPVWVPCGNGCTTMILQNIYTPPCWELYLRNEEGDTGALCVDPNEWARYEVGHTYP
jgi:hypothetical protein